MSTVTAAESTERTAAPPPPRRPGTPPRIIARAVLGLREALKRAGDRLAPEYALLESSVGVIRTRVLGAIAERGLADALAAGPTSADDLAARLGLHADSLHRVLRASAVYGVVKLDRRGRFTLTRAGQLLRSDHPTSLAPWLLHLNQAATDEAYRSLPETLRSGTPSFRVAHGGTTWEHFAANPPEERLFADAMRKFTEADAAMLCGAYRWPAEGVVCDVAGGSGPLLAAALAERPGLRGVLVEAPGVLAEADVYLQRAGVRDRVELREGNFFERIEVEADVYLLKDILHDWDDESSLQILRTIRAAMAPGSELVVLELLQERNRVEPLVSLVDIQMLTQCDGGRQRSVAELHALLREAGLTPGEVHPTAGHALLTAGA
jgi:hypothetical protein